MPNKTTDKDIAQIDQLSKKTHVWFVSVSFIGKIHCKFFSDKKCGGTTLRLPAAISWRNATYKKLGKPPEPTGIS